MKILAFVAHPDDEINCAGLMHKNFLEGGFNEVICFTGNSQRKKEFQNSCKIIGAKPVSLHLSEIEITFNQKLLTLLKTKIIDFKPDIVILQANDYHPDHISVFKICMHAIEFASHGKNGYVIPKILELETSGLIRYPDIIIDITQEQSVRLKAFKCHISQVKGKPFGKYYIDFTEQKARLRGVQIGTIYGEAYKIHNQPIKGNFYPNSRGCFSISDML